MIVSSSGKSFIPVFFQKVEIFDNLHRILSEQHNKWKLMAKAKYYFIYSLNTYFWNDC